MIQTSFTKKAQPYASVDMVYRFHTMLYCYNIITLLSSYELLSV
jgi:hypothetical protein